MRPVPRSQLRLVLIIAVVAAIAVLAPAQALWLLPTLLIAAPVGAGRYVGEAWLIARLPAAPTALCVMTRLSVEGRSVPRSRPSVGAIFARPPPLLFGQ